MTRFSSCLFLFISGLSGVVHAQYTHSFKLEYGEVTKTDYRVQQGQQVLVEYERAWTTVEDEDTIVFRETYKYPKFWRLNRYLLSDGDPKLSGWQQNFDEDGRLFLEQLCQGSKKCTVSRRYTYYPGDQLMTVANYYKEALHGSHLVYYNNGQLRQHIWYENGRMQEVLAYYDDSGNPLDPGELCDGNGDVNVYSMNGSLYKIKTYRKGKARKLKEL